MFHRLSPPSGDDGAGRRDCELCCKRSHLNLESIGGMRRKQVTERALTSHTSRRNVRKELKHKPGSCVPTVSQERDTGGLVEGKGDQSGSLGEAAFEPRLV